MLANYKFNLTDDMMQRLRARFLEFKRERDMIHALLNDYVADYRNFQGNSEQRYEYLRRKFLSRVPDLSHLIFSQGEILWSINDIAIVLGRHRTTIGRSLEKMQHSIAWSSRLLSISENSKASSGLNVTVYRKEIFDLLLDLYEEEYLLRFSQPRRGDPENAPDEIEVRKFWEFLKDAEAYNLLSLNDESGEDYDDEIPPITFGEIIAMIWEKVFSVKNTTICSVIFAICFELTRRFFGINVWLSVIPFTITILCVLIMFSNSRLNFWANVGAMSLLFGFLWVSASLSIDKLTPEFRDEVKSQVKSELKDEIKVEIKTEAESIEPKLSIAPTMGRYLTVDFNIGSNIFDRTLEFLYRIRPNENFRSLGKMNLINPDTKEPYAARTIPTNKSSGIITLDLKYVDLDGNESENFWTFSADLGVELVKLCKQSVLKTPNNYAWLFIMKYYDGNYALRVYPPLFDAIGREAIQEIYYGLNGESPKTRLDYAKLSEPGRGNHVFDVYLVTKHAENDMHLVKSYIMFKDGTSSDIREADY